MIDRNLGRGILFTDQYQLTMAQLYFRMGLHERSAQFDHFFRSYPDYGSHRAGYCIHAGLAWLLDWMRETRSNVGVSHLLGLAPKGAHAHSMVQAFMALGEGELAAFRAYAEVYPDDCLLLVDTVNTLESGIPNAITVFEELKRKGS